MKFYLGGSPCTHWSIAQTKNREIKPSGIGWELFENYLFGLNRYKLDYFLYENNKSMAPAIKEQITKSLGVEPILINSALVSAQNRQRLYWTNIPGVTQPEDEGILLHDVLENAVNEFGYTLRVPDYGGGSKARPLGANYSNNAGGFEQRIWNESPSKQQIDMIAEPIRIGTVESGTDTQHDSKPFRVYSPDGKSVTLQGEAGGMGAKTGLYAMPCALRYERTEKAKKIRKAYESGEAKHGYHEYHELHPRPDGKTNTLSTVLKDNQILDYWDGKTYPVYEVRNGLITIKDKQYPIKLPDGHYIIRKLTVTECKRLQTVPDSYVFPVSNSQAYKMLGNGQTVDVIAHILSFAPGVTYEPIEVLSMYDGMSCGHIALDKLGANVVRYCATEIDKYAIKTTQENYPNTVQLGDAFQVRNSGWHI